MAKDERNDTKTRIMETAERLLILHGPEKTTLRRISAEAGVNLAAVNYHFGSKADLIDALLARLIDPIQENQTGMLMSAVRLCEKGSPSLEAVVHAYIHGIWDFIRDDVRFRNLLHSIFRAYEDDTRLRRQLNRSLQHTEKQFVDALAKALPYLPLVTVVRRFTFMMATTTILMKEGHLDDMRVAFDMELLGDDLPDALIVFLCAGFQAPDPSKPPESLV